MDKRRKDHYVDFYPCSLSYQQGDSSKRKKRGRVRYLNWALEKSDMSKIHEVELDLDDEENRQKIKKDQELESKVHQALNKLDEMERRFIVHFYFDGLSYCQIRRLLKTRKDKLQRIHQSALDKLRLILKDYVEKRFKLKVDCDSRCLICQSLHREELDKLIQGKKKEETWKRIIRTMDEKYHLKIKAPQVLIGHLRKHMLE